MPSRGAGSKKGSAHSLKDDTVREVLALSEKWKERREVYRRLPELIGEPQRVLSLAHQLRKRTRNGNDLFFLDQAIQEVARRSPEYAREATALRKCFYDHIPSPEEELFRWIETPLDARVPLWREIPAGRFWMGSPEDEGEKNEHPRHEVTIARPFRCGVVPVTQSQYAAFDPEHPIETWEGEPREELDHHPVGGVTWYEAVSFCRWLSSVFP